MPVDKIVFQTRIHDGGSEPRHPGCHLPPAGGWHWLVSDDEITKAPVASNLPTWVVFTITFTEIDIRGHHVRDEAASLRLPRLHPPDHFTLARVYASGAFSVPLSVSKNKLSIVVHVVQQDRNLSNRVYRSLPNSGLAVGSCANFWQTFGRISLVFGCIGTDLCK